MSSIPSITASQQKLMLAVCQESELGVFSQRSAGDNDSITNKILLAEANTDATHLASLGFLKEITQDHTEQLLEEEKRTGYKWRVFSITAMGKAMFLLSTSPTIH